jgi:glycosyltransferase involved in cell wall biosynthesis
LRAATRTGTAFVTTYHGAYGSTNRLKNAYNSVMARGDVVIANSDFTARLIAERHRTPKERIRVIHRGVDLRKFDPAAVASARIEDLRRGWGVRHGQSIVLQAARLASWKGHATVIDAVGKLAQAGALGDAVVVMAGDDQGRGSYRQSLVARMNEQGLDGRIRLTGHCRDMPAAFAAADLAIVASTEPEAFGRAVTEASAMGVPIIATDIGAPPETVVAGPQAQRTGWLVQPGDAEALAEAIRAAFSLSSSARSELARRARQHVARSFSVGAMQRATLAVYDELLGTNLAAAFAGTPVHGN